MTELSQFHEEADKNSNKLKSASKSRQQKNVCRIFEIDVGVWGVWVETYGHTADRKFNAVVSLHGLRTFMGKCYTRPVKMLKVYLFLEWKYFSLKFQHINLQSRLKTF